MEFNSPSTVNLVCLNIYNTVRLKTETSIYCVGGAPTRKSAAAAAARRCPKIGGGGATKKSAAAARRDRRRATRRYGYTRELGRVEIFGEGRVRVRVSIIGCSYGSGS